MAYVDMLIGNNKKQINEAQAEITRKTKAVQTYQDNLGTETSLPIQTSWMTSMISSKKSLLRKRRFSPTTKTLKRPRKGCSKILTVSQSTPKRSPKK
jgi:hypothetical protein